MCDVLIEAEEFGLYKTFDLENVDVICNIGYSAAARCFEKVLDENKYETLVKAIAARKKAFDAVTNRLSGQSAFPQKLYI